MVNECCLVKKRLFEAYRSAQSDTQQMLKANSLLCTCKCGKRARYICEKCKSAAQQSLCARGALS